MKLECKGVYIPLALELVLKLFGIMKGGFVVDVGVRVGEPYLICSFWFKNVGILLKFLLVFLNEVLKLKFTPFVYLLSLCFFSARISSCILVLYRFCILTGSTTTSTTQECNLFILLLAN